MTLRLAMRHGRAAATLAALTALAMTLGACGSSGGGPAESTGGGRNSPAGPAGTATSSGSPVTLAIVAELSGSTASIGVPWKYGVEKAVEEINSSGGILGHPVKTFTSDTQGEAAKSASAIRYALGKKPFAVLGPVISSSIVVDEKLTAKQKVPEFVGGIADDITQAGNKWVVRTNPSSSQESRVNAKFLAQNIGAKHVALVYRNDERGQSAKAALSKYLKGYHVTTTAISVSTDQSNYAGLPAKISKSGADAIYLSAVDTQDAQIISALKSSDVKLPITGDQEALSPTVSKLTHNASDGVRGVVDYSPVAPGFDKLAAAYKKTHGEDATAEFYKAYIGTWLIKYAAENAGKLDQGAMMKAIYGNTFCVSKYPKLLQSFYFKPNGDPDGQQYVAKVKGGNQVVSDTVKPLDESKFSSC
jgi:branched-chain amino acid transport system substrate-binding protein